MENLIAIAVRAAAFILTFSLFPATIVPFFVRFAVIGAVVMFSLPLLPSSAVYPSGNEFIVQLNSGNTLLFQQGFAVSVILGNIFVGVLLGVASGLGSVLAQTMASWLTGLLCASLPVWRRFENRSWGPLTTGILLIYLLALIPLLPAHMELFANAMLVMHPTESVLAFQGSAIQPWLQLSLQLGKLTLMTCLLFLLPFLGLSLAIFLVLLPVTRSFRSTVSDSLVISLRYPMILFLMVVTFYLWTSGLVLLPQFMLTKFDIHKFFF